MCQKLVCQVILYAFEKSSIQCNGSKAVQYFVLQALIGGRLHLLPSSAQQNRYFQLFDLSSNLNHEVFVSVIVTAGFCFLCRKNLQACSSRVLPLQKPIFGQVAGFSGRAPTGQSSVESPCSVSRSSFRTYAAAADTASAASTSQKLADLPLITLINSQV